MSAITKLKEKLMLKPDIKEYKPVIINFYRPFGATKRNYCVTMGQASRLSF